jgi:hypothetical protein
MTKGFTLTKRRNTLSPTRREGKKFPPNSLFHSHKSFSKKKTPRYVHHSPKHHHYHHLSPLGHKHVPAAGGLSTHDSNKGCGLRTVKGRRVFYAPHPFPGTSTKGNQACMHVPASVSSTTIVDSHSSCCVAVTDTPQQHPSHQQGMTAKKKTHPQRKYSSNKRWKQFLFKRIRDKDTRVLHFLQSRPPPPTVGSSFLMDASDDETGAEAESVVDNTTVPHPYMHLFDQLDCQLGDEEGFEVEAEDKNTPIDESPPPRCHAPNSHTISASATASASSLDLFGSYLHDYRQSDYTTDLFDENMLIC